MGEFDTIDFFRGNELVADPYPYFDSLRQQCPVQREPHHDVVMVTGYDEAVSVYTNTATFSSCNSVTGPFPGFPVALEGDDVSALIEAAPRAAALQRPDPHHGPARAQGAPWAVDAPDHAEAPARERGLHVAARRPPDRRVRGAGGVRVHRGLRRPVHALRHRRPPRGPRRGPRVVQGGAPRGWAAPPTGPRQYGILLVEPLTAGVPLRPLRRVRGGAAPRAARRRPDRSGHGQLPGRLASRGDRGGPRGRQRLLGRPGDHGPAPRDGTADHRRTARHPGRACERTGRASPTSSRSASVTRAR